MPILTLYPSLKKIEADFGETIYSVVRRNDIPLGSSCGGDGICDTCRVTIVLGHENLSEINDTEIRLRNEHDFTNDERVACQTKIFGDVGLTTGYW